MAERAVSGLQGRMDVWLCQPYLLLAVAGKAESVARLLQQQLRNYPVTDMAILALLLLDDGVNTLHAEVFFCKFGVAVETVLLHEFLGCMGGIAETTETAPHKAASTKKRNDRRCRYNRMVSPRYCLCLVPHPGTPDKRLYFFVRRPP